MAARGGVGASSISGLVGSESSFKQLSQFSDFGLKRIQIQNLRNYFTLEINIMERI